MAPVTSEQIVPAEEEDELPPSWASEPEDLDTLMNEHILECKVPGRAPGTTLMVVEAKKRDGSVMEIIDGQRHKLFLASCHNKYQHIIFTLVPVLFPLK